MCVGMCADGSPSMLDLRRLFNVELLSGQQHQLRHFQRFELVTTRQVANLPACLPLGAWPERMSLRRGGWCCGCWWWCWMVVLCIAGSLRRFMEKLSSSDKHNATCFVTHASRNDIVMGLISHAHACGSSFKGGMILTGRQGR